MDRLVMQLATGFGLGRLPKAPGTWGTLLAFPLHYLLISFSPSNIIYAISLLGFTVLAIIVSGMAEKIIDRPDPGIVVIDEVAGMLIALIAVPTNLLAWLTAFVFFRLFDIFKPFPIKLIDSRVHGGTGIVLDDILAGVYALACTHALIFLFPAIFQVI